MSCHSHPSPRNWLNAATVSNLFTSKIIYMPLLTAPACNPSVDCPLIEFPQSTAACEGELSVGGINDLYFIPCTETLSEANIMDLGWWSDLIAASFPAATLGKLGIGLGSITKKGDKKERTGSCRIEQVVQTTWAITYILKYFDKTSARITNEQVNALITKAGNFQLVARMCEGENTILPIGPFTTSDFNWTVPDNFEEYQSITLELSWVELGLPRTYDVAGLSTVLPKS